MFSKAANFVHSHSKLCLKCIYIMTLMYDVISDDVISELKYL